MPRVARIVIPGLPHHITQRGNRRAPVFFRNDDYHCYIDLLARYSVKHRQQIWAYCLMPNHIHLIVLPEAEESIAHALRDTNTAYALHINRREEQKGHLWQGRFYSCALDVPHLWHAIRYVERNPVRAGLAADAADFSWSSAAARCGLRQDNLVSNALPGIETVGDWRSWLRDESTGAHDEIRHCTNTGRPCGTAEWVRSLENELGRSLAPQKRGRKPRTE